ncbi:MAG TPA: hypothetical protein VD858_04790 [Reyranella sp.]|nr:hypothetical protein [Reyranella sp.]
MTLAVRPATLEVFVRREFAAPRDVVFAAWTNERLIGRWWAARTYTALARWTYGRAAPGAAG